MDATLKKYLENVIALEKTVYTQQRTINGLNHRIKDLAIPRRIVKETLSERREYCKRTDKLADDDGFSWLVCLGSLIFVWLSVKTGIQFNGVVLVISGLLCLVFFLLALTNHNRERDHNDRLQKYIDEVYEQSIRNEKQRLAQEEREQNRLVQQRDALLQAQSSTKEALQAYYTQNIIYPKYQNVIAVCSFYEYFMTGRCSTFTGHEGAYNLFEHEVLMNRILNQLDVVIQKLENIQQSQHELYRTLSEGQATAKQLYQETVRQSQLLEYNAQQTAIAAYNAQEARKEVEDLKWLKVTEMIYR